MLEFLKSRLRPFNHRGFRYFFFAQNLSLIGTWSHELARSWLVLSISGTAAALGTVLLATSLPALFLSLHGGVIADRIDVRRFSIITKSVLAVAALTLFFITEFSQITIPIILFFAMIEGFVNSYDGPIFTAMFARMIPRSDFQQALAIQSTNFHMSRMVGPMVAGILMAWKGPAWVFLFDFVSYVWVIYVIWRIELRPIEKRTEADATLETKSRMLKLFDGILYFFKHPQLRYMQLQLFLMLGLILPVLTVVFRTYLKPKFALDASGFGFLFAFPAIGSITGAILFILMQRQRPFDNLKWAVPGLVLALYLIHFAPTPYIAAALLSVCGFFSYVNVASVTQNMHLLVPDYYRGRLGSLIGLGFVAIGPLMSFPLGYYADKMGFEAAILHPTIVYAVLTAILANLQFRNGKKAAINALRHEEIGRKSHGA
jgi:MFS family permease